MACFADHSDITEMIFFIFRDFRGNKVALFDGIEEGGIRASASYSHEIDEHDNERAVDGLQDRVNLLKRVSSPPPTLFIPLSFNAWKLCKVVIQLFTSFFY